MESSIRFNFEFIGSYYKFHREFRWKFRGFDLKKNFEIEPSLKMGVMASEVLPTKRTFFQHTTIAGVRASS